MEVLDNCFGAGHIEFAGRVHEVELRVDVPEEQSRRHGRDLGGARLFQLDSLVRRLVSHRILLPNRPRTAHNQTVPIGETS